MAKISSVRFEEALAQTANQKRYLLLGNGFSIAAHAPFAYSSLFEIAVSTDPTLKPIFERAKTKNFELVIAKTSDLDLKARVRSALVQAVTDAHPKSSLWLSNEQKASCAEFLRDFVGLERGDLRGRIYTTNYDLLLYWVVVAHNALLKAYDGCDTYGVWDEARLHNSQVLYLHGALHLYERQIGRDGTRETYKVTYEPGLPLIDQIKARLRAGEAPLFVSEGDPWHKLEGMRGARYLEKVKQAWSKDCNDEAATIFTIGHSLSTEDKHLTRWIREGRVGSLYVGAFNEGEAEQLRKLTASWQHWREAYGRPPLEVSIFLTPECKVWTRTTVP